ncbi:MAG: branched-chain amino acid ABC transporter permease [Spirochaetaceae bacterium]|jgi:branched-chain amino acid transport system permease protein|nr:branched-chain amino acid ABC transporter permease [Spirochaetaceae bacterium]
MKKPLAAFLPFLCTLLVIAAPALLIKAGVIDAYIAQIITAAGVNAILAISVNLITGFCGQLSLGQAGFMAIGAYTCISLNLDLGLPLPAAAIAASSVAAFASFLIGFPSLKLTGDYLAIVTLGFGEIIRVILTNLRPITGGANGRQFTTIIAVDPALAFLVVTLSLTAVIILFQNFNRSTYGRAILAVREDEIAANSSGIGIFRYKMAAFICAGFIAGLGGALYAMIIGFVKPDIASFTKSIDYLIFVVLGGMGSLTGSVIASYVLTAMQEALRFLKDYRLLFYPLILIFVMLFRPQGLLGMKEFSFMALARRIFAVTAYIKKRIAASLLAKNRKN